MVITMMMMFAGDREDGEGDRGAEVEGVGRCGGAEEAFQECQVSNHDDDDDDYGDNDGNKAVQWLSHGFGTHRPFLESTIDSRYCHLQCYHLL